MLTALNFEIMPINIIVFDCRDPVTFLRNPRQKPHIKFEFYKLQRLVPGEFCGEETGDPRGDWQ